MWTSGKECNGVMDDLLFYFETKIPSYVFLVSFLIMAFVIISTLVSRPRRIRTKTCIFASLLAEYYFLVLCSTVFYRNVAEQARLELMPFWNYELIASWKDPRDFWEVVLNIVLFIPIGFLFKGLSQRISWWHVLIVGMMLSTVIEVSQYYLHRGLCETNDVIHNSIGCLIGAWMAKFVSKEKRKYENK